MGSIYLLGPLPDDDTILTYFDGLDKLHLLPSLFRNFLVSVMEQCSLVSCQQGRSFCVLVEPPPVSNWLPPSDSQAFPGLYSKLGFSLLIEAYTSTFPPLDSLPTDVSRSFSNLSLWSLHLLCLSVFFSPPHLSTGDPRLRVFSLRSLSSFSPFHQRFFFFPDHPYASDP